MTHKISGTNTVLNAGEDYTVDFVSNVNKGKAVVIIKGAEGQTVYVGSKIASFSIVAKKFKSDFCETSADKFPPRFRE